MNNKIKNPISKEQLDNTIKKLVIERIKASSGNVGIMIGSSDYSKEDILKSVEKEDEIGKEIIEMQMDYLRDMANGAIYE